MPLVTPSFELEGCVFGNWKDEERMTWEEGEAEGQEGKDLSSQHPTHPISPGFPVLGKEKPCGAPWEKSPWGVGWRGNSMCGLHKEETHSCCKLCF